MRPRPCPASEGNGNHRERGLGPGRLCTEGKAAFASPSSQSKAFVVSVEGLCLIPWPPTLIVVTCVQEGRPDILTFLREPVCAAGPT